MADDLLGIIHRLGLPIGGSYKEHWELSGLGVYLLSGVNACFSWRNCCFNVQENFQIESNVERASSMREEAICK